MTFSVKKISGYISNYQSFLKLGSNDREVGFIKQAFNDCSNYKNVIYALFDEQNIIYGFIALSASKVELIPCLLIDYIFVVKEYRKIIFPKLNNLKVSAYLLSLADDIAEDIKSKIGLKWIVLIADNDKLADYYVSEFDFKKFKSKEKFEYLFIKI
ncbi:MAG: hypothetical protein HXX81_07935 [Campylobacterales bacterium]|nr:hypothetical protein [Campylobacterales bacterium]